ncbi:MAG: endonuclease/exonuclease/phosphatase family protein [Cyclobacteriaceae bacterium]
MAYLSPHISPADAWLAGFLSLTIPGLLLLHAFLLAYYIVQRRKWYLYSLISLALGYQYLMVSFSVSNPPPSAEGAFTILSYNVRVFNTYAYLHTENEPGKAMIEWLSEQDADIKCLQEYYNDDQSALFNSTRRLSSQGDYQAYIRPTLVNRIGAEFGLAIFSRYPITERGVVALPDSTPYAMYADIETEQGVVRIYNVHLQSMSIDENDLSDFERARNNYATIFHKLKSGFISRAGQIDHLLTHIESSPYPVAVCGDFNDIPYSYTYFTLRHQLRNAFERAGNGLGFSYNGKLFFLRIDNQFFSENLKVHQYQTLRNITYSDHFPVKTQYTFIKKQ